MIPDRRLTATLSVWGPGLLVMLADTDVGNVVTAAESGTRWGYRLLPLILLLIPLLYMMQELAVRLGLFTGSGFAALIRTRFGAGWAGLAVAALAIATFGSLVTELTGVAGVGELYQVPRSLTLPLAAAALLLIVLTGRYRRVERIALIVGLFELSFFAVAWAAHPQLADVLHEVADQRLADPRFLYLGAALIGATFNPWMVFYQASALSNKRLAAAQYGAARADTAIGAVLTQLVTAAVLVAAAATLGSRADRVSSLTSIGQISEALTPLLGAGIGRLVFGMGVIGAAMVAAIVCSLALAWSLGEVTGPHRSADAPPVSGAWFIAGYIACILAGTALVWLDNDLVWLSIATQAVNAALLPLVAGLLVVLSMTALPKPIRLHGRYLWLVSGLALLVSTAGIVGAVAGLP